MFCQMLAEDKINCVSAIGGIGCGKKKDRTLKLDLVLHFGSYFIAIMILAGYSFFFFC